MMKKTRPGMTDSQVRARIQAAGLRCTAARFAVLKRLLAAGIPLSHAEVTESLSSAGFDSATVYRNLIELTEAQLVSRIELGNRVWRFEARGAGGAQGEDHPHFVCTRCGRVRCLDGTRVRVTPGPSTAKSGIREITEILLRGLCRSCS